MSPGPPEPVVRLIAAANNHDTGAFLACFTPDGVVDDWGRTFTGPTAITEWSDREFIGVNVALEITAISTVGDQTTVSANVGGDGFNGPSHFTFTVRDDHVAQMTIRA